MLAVEVVLLSGVAVGVLTHISIRHIMLNAISSSSGTEAFVRFFIDNFFVKSIQSRLLVAMYLVLAVFFVRDVYATLGRARAGSRGELLRALALGDGNRTAIY